MSHENKNFSVLITACLVIYLFAEFDDAANLLAANPDATTISIDEPVEIPKNQHSRLQEPGREEDDELLGTDDSDKTEVMLSPLLVQACEKDGEGLLTRACREKDKGEGIKTKKEEV